MNNTVSAATLLALSLAAIAAPASAATYDLTADWSNASNPNGPWSYLQGSTPLPFVPAWRATDLNGFTQPAWAQSNTPGAFLPAIFQTVATGSAECATCDWAAGDIITHNTDPSNGGGDGIANILFTSPVSGLATISGLVWEARVLHRTETYSLSIGGVVVQSGTLMGDGSQGSAHPVTFSFSGIGLTAGEFVDLSFDRAPGEPFGDFIGSNLHVNLSPTGVPEPSTWAMMLVGFGGLGAVTRSRRKLAVASA